jgi:hypothetical protein
VIWSILSVGWPTPTGTPWPFLPQVPMPGSSFMSLPIMPDAGQRVGAVADQHGALDRRPDLAVLDPVGLGAGEDELAGGDVDLAAAEGDGVDAVLDRGEDFRRVGRAGEHEVLVIRGIGIWA